VALRELVDTGVLGAAPPPPVDGRGEIRGAAPPRGRLLEQRWCGVVARADDPEDPVSLLDGATTVAYVR
jgi:hypothetical protein